MQCMQGRGGGGAIVSGGAVECWGDDTYGQLGDDTFTSSSTPVAVSGVTGATVIAAGSDQACAIVAGGAVTCWGSNYWGELGNGALTRPTGVRTTIAGLTGATAISCGFQQTCALLSAGGIECWGMDSAGELGNGVEAALGAVGVVW